jgi:hypothetical protein
VLCKLEHVQDQKEGKVVQFTHSGRSVQTKNTSAAESRIEPVLFSQGRSLGIKKKKKKADLEGLREGHSFAKPKSWPIFLTVEEQFEYATRCSILLIKGRSE